MSWLASIGNFLKPLATAALGAIAPSLISTIGSAAGGLVNTIGNTGSGVATTIGTAAGNLGQSIGGDTGRNYANQILGSIGQGVMSSAQNKICAEERSRINDLEQKVRTLQTNIANANLKRPRGGGRGEEMVAQKKVNTGRAPVYDFERVPEEEGGYFGELYNNQ
jgi:hypothetical protein